MDTSQAEGQQRVQRIDKEAVKTLALVVGVREAARQLGLNQNTVRSWSLRDNWLEQKQAEEHLPPAFKGPASKATKSPSEALLAVLQEDSNRTKIGFSRAARKIAEKLPDLEDDKLLAAGADAKAWAGVASQVHGWEQKQGSEGNTLNVLSLGGEMTIKVGE